MPAVRRRMVTRAAGAIAILLSSVSARGHAPPPSLPHDGAGAVAPPAGYPVKYFDVLVEGQALRMAYRDVSPEAATEAPVVVLMHCKNFSGFYWEPVIRRLVAGGFRVVAPDQIGFGSSSKPNIHYTFHALAELTAGLLDHLGVRRSYVVGHSMGGMLAIRFALMYPERTLKLVLEDPIGLEDYRPIVPYTSVDAQFRDELGATYAARVKEAA